MNQKLTGGQIAVLISATLPMIGAGILGGIGTYTNVKVEFERAATALGVVAAGEGVVLILALVMVGLTMLGQTAPAPVRIGLWVAPIAAAVTGVAVADNNTERVVYAMTPMAMSAAAEGLGLLARRIVVYRTGVDMEAQRRNAATMQRLAYHRARTANHPDARTRKRSDRISWRLARRVGVGDAQLGTQLVDVQRTRLHDGADAALGRMLNVDAAAAAIPQLRAAAAVDAVFPVQPQPAADDFERAADEAVTVSQPTAPAQPQPDAAAAVPAPDAADQPTTEAAPEAVDCAPAAAQPANAADAQPGAADPVVRPMPDADADAQLLKDALAVNASALAETGRPASLRRLQAELGIGQRRAQRIQSQLPKSA